MAYNLSGYDNVRSLLDIMNASNNVTDGYFSILILMSVFIISVISFRSAGTEWKSVFFGSSIVTTFLSVLLKLTGLISDKWVIINIVIMSLTIIMMMWREK